MADRTSAHIFGTIFHYLAGQPDTKERKELALFLWHSTFEYDFSTYQMGADEALIKLGLAKKDVDPDEPDESSLIVVYPDSNGHWSKP